MKLNLFYKRNKEMQVVYYKNYKVKPYNILDYGFKPIFYRTGLNNTSYIELRDKLFLYLSLHFPQYVKVDKLKSIKLEEYSFITKFVRSELNFKTDSSGIASSIYLPFIGYSNDILKWISKDVQKKPIKLDRLQGSYDTLIDNSTISSTEIPTLHFTLDKSLKDRPTISVENIPIYSIRETFFNIRECHFGEDVKIISKRQYNNINTEKDCSFPYFIMGIYNYISNEFITFFPEEETKDYIESVRNILKEYEIYFVNFKTSTQIKIGYEQEFLFLDKEEKIVPATNIFIDQIENKFIGLQKDQKGRLQNNGRDTLNSIFNFTTVGTDGRRILGELRDTYYNISITNEEQTLHSIRKLWKAIETGYNWLSPLIPNIRIGGGKDGETIGTHIHFSLPQSPQFVILLNKVFGKKLQDMNGGKRPERINPPDRLVLNDRDRGTDNTYGIINNSIEYILHDFNDNHGIQVRTKKDQNGNTWWEWRIPPACFLNKTFTINLFMSIYYILNLTYRKDFEFSEQSIYSKDILYSIFNNNSYFWEWYYMTNSLSLDTCPFNYTDPKKIRQLLNNLIFIKTSKKELYVKDYEKFDIHQLQESLKDYINPKKITYVKFEYQKYNTIILHECHKENIQFWITLYGINIKSKFINSKNKNSFTLQGRFTSNELYLLSKICLLINY